MPGPTPLVNNSWAAIQQRPDLAGNDRALREQRNHRRQIRNLRARGSRRSGTEHQRPRGSDGGLDLQRAVWRHDQRDQHESRPIRGKPKGGCRRSSDNTGTPLPGETCPYNGSRCELSGAANHTGLDATSLDDRGCLRPDTRRRRGLSATAHPVALRAGRAQQRDGHHHRRTATADHLHQRLAVRRWSRARHPLGHDRRLGQQRRAVRPRVRRRRPGRPAGVWRVTSRGRRPARPARATSSASTRPRSPTARIRSRRPSSTPRATRRSPAPCRSPSKTPPRSRLPTPITPPTTPPPPGPLTPGKPVKASPRLQHPRRDADQACAARARHRRQDARRARHDRRQLHAQRTLAQRSEDRAGRKRKVGRGPTAAQRRLDKSRERPLSRRRGLACSERDPLRAPQEISRGVEQTSSTARRRTQDNAASVRACAARRGSGRRRVSARGALAGRGEQLPRLPLPDSLGASAGRAAPADGSPRDQQRLHLRRGHLLRWRGVDAQMVGEVTHPSPRKPGTVHRAGRPDDLTLCPLAL